MDWEQLGEIFGVKTWGVIVGFSQYVIGLDTTTELYSVSVKQLPNRGKIEFLGENIETWKEAVAIAEKHHENN